MNGVAIPSPNASLRRASPTITVMSHVITTALRANGFVQLRETNQPITSAIRKGAAVPNTPETEDASS